MDRKQIFADNLKRLMDKHEKSRNDICAALDFNYYTFSDWLNGKKYPRIDKIEKLAEYFAVPISELIERQTPKSAIVINDFTVDFGKVISDVRIKHNLSVEEFAETLGTTSEMIKLFESNKVFPIQYLPVLHKKYNIAYRELLGLERLYDVAFEWIFALDLTHDQLKEVYRYAKFIKKDDEK